MKRFVLLVRQSTEEQNNNFIKYAEANNMTWWHWIPNAWLIVDFSGNQTPATLRNELKRLFPKIRTMVLDVTDAKPHHWAGFGPSSATDPKQNMFRWIHEFWDLRS